MYHLSTETLMIYFEKTLFEYLSKQNDRRVSCDDVDDSHCVQNPFLIIINEQDGSCAWRFWKVTKDAVSHGEFDRERILRRRNRVERFGAHSVTQEQRQSAYAFVESSTENESWNAESVLFAVRTDQSADSDRSASVRDADTVASSVLYYMSKSSVHTDSSHRVVRLANSRVLFYYRLA